MHRWRAFHRGTRGRLYRGGGAQGRLEVMKGAWTIVAMGCLACGARANDPTANTPSNAARQAAGVPTASSAPTAPSATASSPIAPTAAPSATAAPAGSYVSNASAAPRLVPHTYRRVFHGSGSLLVTGPEPYLIATEGAVNLKTQVIDFEREFANWGAFQGDSLWFADRLSPMSACPEPSTLAQRVGSTWIPRLEANVHSLVVQPWTKGSSLAAIVPYRSGPPWGYELTVLERNRNAPKPARRSPNQLTECETRIAWFQALVAFRSGEIFAFGGECATQPLPEDDPAQTPAAEDAPWGHAVTQDDESVDPDRPDLPPTVMESWHKGRHEFIDVPFRELSRVIGVGPKDIWATGTRDDETWAVGYFDGTAWQLLPDYYDHQLVALHVYPGETGRDARRLLLTTQQLFETSHGATTEHELPPDCRAHNLTLDGAELWVECYEDDEITLYTTRTDIAEFRFDTEAPDRKLVNFTDKAYPRLDPKAHSLRSCGSREFETPERPTPSRNPDSKPSPRPGGKPSPQRNKSRSNLTYDADFGF